MSAPATKTFRVYFCETRLYSKQIRAASPNDAIRIVDTFWMATRPVRTRHFTLDDISTDDWQAEEAQL
jgi:hypothetical protein